MRKASASALLLFTLSLHLELTSSKKCVRDPLKHRERDSSDAERCQPKVEMKRERERERERERSAPLVQLPLSLPLPSIPFVVLNKRKTKAMVFGGLFCKSKDPPKAPANLREAFAPLSVLTTKGETVKLGKCDSRCRFYHRACLRKMCPPELTLLFKKTPTFSILR